MANINSLFNYGTAPEEGGWKVFSNKKFEDSVESTDIAGMNPNQAVPSPYARFELARRAFENLASGNEDLRDMKIVSEVFDVLQVLFEGAYSFNPIVSANISVISNDLITLGSKNNEEKHLKIYGEALRDYYARESFMNAGGINQESLYVFAQGADPFAITSPTSIVLPTPDTDIWKKRKILVEGKYPVFTKQRGLQERNRNFVIYVYRLMKAIEEKQGGYPAAIKPMANYLAREYEMLGRSIPELFDIISDIRNKQGGEDLKETYDIISESANAISVFGVPLGCIRKTMASEEVARESDLFLNAKKFDGESLPLVLSTNIPQGSRLRYTSATNYWDSKDSKLDYRDEKLKWTPVEARTQLPNGIPYPGGFIYEHDFLSDYLIRLPYKFNKDIFFDGNLNDNEIEEGFVPPITEKYFEYFTVDDLKEQMRINLKKAGSAVMGVEVLLKLPLTNGGHVIFKKTYNEIDQKPGAYNQTAKNDARGKIVALDAALTYFPNIKFSDREYNHYLFQLARDSFNQSDNDIATYDIEMKAVLEGKNEESLPMKKAVRVSEDGIPAVTHYALNGKDFSYLKFTLEKRGQSEKESNPVCFVLIPVNFKYYDVNRHRRGLAFGFDFGTSNTHVTAMTVDASESKELKFTLPFDQCVSTISKDAEMYGMVGTFINYQNQLILPKRKDFGFPIPTVISKPKNESEWHDDTEIPFLHSSIPFQYGKEDYGVNANDIVRNLKWGVNTSEEGLKHYAKSFINELVFLAQVYAVEQDAGLRECEMTWSYPISMSNGLRNTLKESWGKAFSEYFGGTTGNDSRVESFTESMAPMVYYKATQGNDLIGTVVSIDIGGGTTDIVVSPNSDFNNSKLASIGLGGDNLFAIKGATTKNIGVLTWAIDMIKKRVLAHKKHERDKKFDNIIRELDSLKESPEAEATNILFGLPFKKELKEFADEVDFNKLLVSRPGFHPVFHYYYASILYYLARMMKSNPDTFVFAPEKFFFSGSGSKILEIVGKGSVGTLRDFTMNLFWFFLDGYEFPVDESDEFSLKMERKEPKEITAKGCIIEENGASKLREIINEQTGKNKAASVYAGSEGGGKRNLFVTKGQKGQKKTDIIVKYKLIDSIDNGGRTLKEKDLSNPEIQKEILQEIEKFHQAYSEFIKTAIDNGVFYEDEDLYSFKRDFFDKKLRWELLRQLKAENLDAKSDSEEEYADVPFFLVIKRLIQESINPRLKAED